MSEWWTYSLRDFLLFSPTAYRRVLEQYNAQAWPAQWVGALVCIAIIGVLALRVPGAVRIVSMLLAAMWAAVAWDFLAGHYATINWAATYVAGAFGVQAGLLLVAALRPPGGAAREPPLAGPAWVRASGYALLALAAAYPGIALVAGRGLPGAEWFGLMPDPTALGTLGALLLVPARGRAWLVPLPLAAVALGAATAYLLRVPEGWVLAACAALAVVAFATQARARREAPPGA